MVTIPKLNDEREIPPAVRDQVDREVGPINIGFSQQFLDQNFSTPQGKLAANGLADAPGNFSRVLNGLGGPQEAMGMLDAALRRAGVNVDDRDKGVLLNRMLDGGRRGFQGLSPHHAAAVALGRAIDEYVTRFPDSIQAAPPPITPFRGGRDFQGPTPRRGDGKGI